MSIEASRRPSGGTPLSLNLRRPTNSTPVTKSPVVKRSIIVAGHMTSVSVEDAFWKGLKEIAYGRDLTLSEMVGMIKSGHEHNNLSSAIRLFVLDHYRSLMDAVAARLAAR